MMNQTIIFNLISPIMCRLFGDRFRSNNKIKRTINFIAIAKKMINLFLSNYNVDISYTQIVFLIGSTVLHKNHIVHFAKRILKNILN